MRRNLTDEVESTTINQSGFMSSSFGSAGEGRKGPRALNINMDNRLRGFRAAAASLLLVFLLAVSGLAMAEADPIRVSSLSEPQSVISEQDVSITIKIYNSSQKDMDGDIVLFDPSRHSVDKYFGLKGEQSLTYNGTWHVTQDQIDEGKIKYYIQYTVDTDDGPTKVTRTVPITIQTEDVAPQLTATYSVSPTSARKGQKVTVSYTLSNTGNIELRDIVVSNKGISDKKLNAASLSVGEKVTLTDSFTMGDNELVSKPTISYHTADSDKVSTISDMARKTITVAEDGLEASIKVDKAENIYPGEKLKLSVTFKNSGEHAYTGLSAELSDGTPIASGVELAPGASFDQDVEWAPRESTQLFVSVSGEDASGEAVAVSSEPIEIVTQDASKALVLDVKTQAQETVIHSEPAVVRFGVVVENIGQTDASTLTIKEAGTKVATIASLPSGESRTVVFDLETSIAGKIQFEVTGKDADGNDKSYLSNVIDLVYIAPTPAPTATPAPTPVPPTPSPVPTATPVPSIGEVIASKVNPVVLYSVAGVLAALIVAVVTMNSIKSAKKKKRMDQALDTIELSPDVRDSFGKRRRRDNKAQQRPQPKKEEEPIVPAEELTPEETMTPARDAMRRMEGEEGHHRRAQQEVSTDKTLRVAPVSERPEVPAQKVDDSQTRIFGKLNIEEEPEQQDAQETVRLDRETIEEIRRKTDPYEGSGKKRSEMKPMKKKKKGLFGRGKDDDDDFVEEPEWNDDDDDFFE